VTLLSRLWAFLRSLPQGVRAARYWGRRERAGERGDAAERRRERRL
jgi:hypothetical protein